MLLFVVSLKSKSVNVEHYKKALVLKSTKLYLNLVVIVVGILSGFET